MKNWKRYMLVFIGIMLLFGCGYPKRKLQKENKKKTVSDYTELTMFSDVSYWELPEWSLDEGSVTGEITKRTGVIIDDIVPRRMQTDS